MRKNGRDDERMSVRKNKRTSGREDYNNRKTFGMKVKKGTKEK